MGSAVHASSASASTQPATAESASPARQQSEDPIVGGPQEDTRVASENEDGHDLDSSPTEQAVASDETDEPQEPASTTTVIFAQTNGSNEHIENGDANATSSSSAAASSSSASASSVIPATPASQPGDPLPKLTSKSKLPDLSIFHLFPEQLKHPLFAAIARVLVVQGNAWQSATDLVGRTPRGTIQGAISTALSVAHSLGTFEPIQKYRLNSTTYYRMAPRTLDPTLPDDSDATESDSIVTAPRKDVSKGKAVAKPKPKATSSNTKRKAQPSGSRGAGNSNKKRKPVSGWESDTLSSGSSDDDTRQNGSSSRHNTSNHNHRHQQSSSGSKRTRAYSPNSSSSSRAKAPIRRNSIPNGLKKLPKGYVYDTEFNQAALMNLSVNPSQTGEYMRLLKGKNAEENNFPDRRGEYGVDLTQEPSMFALEQQTGYTYPRLRTSGRERLLKADCEDGYAIADLKHNGSFLGRLFCITDGHGGRACSSFVIATIPGAMQVILGKYKPSDLSRPSVQELVKTQITEAIRLIDKEYLEYKKQQYLLFKSKQIPKDPGSDGTTLIVNVFIDKWIICLNLGDSRTMLGSRDPVGRWNVDFYSEDHTPSLERLAQSIYANGGEFVTHDDKVIRFDPNLKNDKKHRQSLKEARIRVKDAASNPYGIPYMTKNGHCASVNLGACIGDVLYKLDPINPVLGCKPDITFIDITDIQQGFLLMASDGLWDYVQRGGKVQDQNATVCQFVGDKLERGWNHQRIVYTLSDREGATGLYSDSIQEYDDFTAILVTFNKQQLLRQQQQQQEQEQRLVLLQQQRLQEQQILLLQQHHQKQRELERLEALKQLQIQKGQAELDILRREQELLRKATGDKSENDTDSDLTEPEPDQDADESTASQTSLLAKTESNAGSVKDATVRPKAPKNEVERIKQDLKQEVAESSLQSQTLLTAATQS
ncbi:Protein phosphatase 1L [Gamsiella multidivaricata]|nr:Protein phosphatase 1L [Gamsiella multidivaricata]